MDLKISNRELGSSHGLELVINDTDDTRIGRIEFGRKWVRIWLPKKKTPLRVSYADFIKQLSKRKR